MRLLIDGDLLVYKAGFGVAKEGTPPVSHSLHGLDATLTKQINHLKNFFTVRSFTVYLTADDKSNFRYEVAQTQEYKANRKDSPKPPNYQEMREFLVSKYDAVMVSGMEADDAIGIESQKLKDKCVIVSQDKDLRMLPGWHWEMGERRPYHTDELGFLYLEKKHDKTNYLFGGGYKWFCAQILLGDSSDNIPGVPKYGYVKTYKALQDLTSPVDLINKIKEIYDEHGFTHSRLQEVKELLWIKQE